MKNSEISVSRSDDETAYRIRRKAAPTVYPNLKEAVARALEKALARLEASEGSVTDTWKSPSKCAPRRDLLEAVGLLSFLSGVSSVVSLQGYSPGQLELVVDCLHSGKSRKSPFDADVRNLRCDWEAVGADYHVVINKVDSILSSRGKDESVEVTWEELADKLGE